MDTTYWGRGFGVMLFKDALTKENLLKYYVKNETNALYVQGINELKSLGFEVIGIVCDGRKGLIQSFEKDDKLNHFDDYVEFVNTYIPNFIGKKDEIIKLTSNDGIDIYVTWVEC